MGSGAGRTRRASPSSIRAYSAVTVSAAQDVFELVAPSNSRVAIRSISLGQYSDAGDAAAELLSERGHTTSGSGGSSATPRNLAGHTGARSAGATVETNNTVVAADGSPVTLLADSWNVAGGWRYLPVPEERFALETEQRLVIRLSAPADAVTHAR